jgi:hypothetical protein
MDQLVRLNMRSPFTEDMLENVSLKIRQAWWWGDAPPSVLLAHPIDSAVMNHGNKPGRESRAACFDVTLKQRHVVGRKRCANFREYFCDIVFIGYCAANRSDNQTAVTGYERVPRASCVARCKLSTPFFRHAGECMARGDEVKLRRMFYSL